MTPRKFEQLDDKIKRNMDRDKNTSTKLMTIANDKKVELFIVNKYTLILELIS